jgi:hypothetical protein
VLMLLLLDVAALLSGVDSACRAEGVESSSREAVRV